MIKNFLLAIAFLATVYTLPATAQKFSTLNEGGTSQKKYFITLPYKEVKNKVIVPVTISGKQYKFIVDTGASTTISKKLFDELNAGVITSLPITDQSGIVDSMEVATLNNIRIGDVTFNNIPSIVLKKEEMLLECFGVDGLIGSNLLRDCIIQFNSKEHTILLTDDKRNLNLKNKYASKMQLTDVQSNPFIHINAISDYVNGKDHVLFDSGMDGFYDLSIDAYKETFEPVKLFNVLSTAKGAFLIGLHGNALNQEIVKVSVPQININKSVFTNVTTITTHGHSSRIGADLFAYGNVTLDYINKKFYFEPYSDGATNLYAKEWPFLPTVHNNKVVVGVVWDRTLDTIINPGDEILSFNNENYQDANICDLIANNNSGIDTAIIVIKNATTGVVTEHTISKQ